MSAIARVLQERGEQVTGSDRAPSTFSEALQADGVMVTYHHSADNVAGADLVLASAAIAEDNVELAAARQAGISVLRRDAFWSELTGGSRTLAVAGTHGKTTTSGLIAWLLSQTGRDPSFIVGGELLDLGVNARAGHGGSFVIEADEYGLAFLGMHPEIAVITNVEHDHPDQFPTPASMHEAFQTFVDQVTGMLILGVDDEGARSLESPGRQRISFGLSDQADWRAEELRPNGAGGSDFLVLRQGEVLGLARTRLPGRHNVVNALGALAAVDAVGVPFAEVRGPLTEFRGAARRFQVVGQAAGATVIDDYAHHPTEIRAALQAARQRYPDARLVAVFQPHTFSRTKQFLPQLAGAFDQADRVIVTDIYASREAPDPTIDSARVVAALDHGQASHIGSLQAAATQVLTELTPGTVVITLSAGDGNEVARLVWQGWQASEGGKNDG